MLPMAEMVGWLRNGVGELIRQAALKLMQLLMEEEVNQMVGQRRELNAGTDCSIGGAPKDGYAVVMGQKVPGPPALRSFCGRRSGNRLGQLRDVSSRRAPDRNRLGKAHAGI